MHATHHDTEDRPFRHYSIATAKVLGGALVLSMLVLIGWNMFAPDLLDLPEARFRQAFGLVLITLALAAIMRGRTPGQTRGPRHVQ